MCLRRSIEVKFSELTAEWRINGKSSPNYNDVAAYVTYGTERANAYRILEETLNLKDIRIYDTIEDADGKQKRVLNKKETTLAQQKQQAIKDAFRDWVWRDPYRRETLSTKYNELFNSTRPREYDGSHIRFGGMNPDITLREHQRNAMMQIPRQRKKTSLPRFVPDRCECCLAVRKRWAQEPTSRTNWWQFTIWMWAGVRLI